ncbi:MAG: transglycosylase SLT domain-containing protein [Candidatus Eremiobacteraeota bacterium]|nr:transglycosylase SLT domain-containing protein [Candidatus Eremiobacteraeota bacterium]
MDALGGIRYGAEITAAALGHGLDPKLLAAVAAQETGGPGSDSGSNIVGDGGHGHGLFQIDDRTWAFASSAAAMDPAANADAAAGILRDDLDRYGGNVRAALSAYNSGSPAGSGTATTWTDGRTLGYADSVLRHYAALGGDPAQLLADNRTTAGSVTALATLGATQLAAPSTPAATTGATSLASGSAGYAAALEPPVVSATSTSPFAAPVSWANETSANGPAGGKEAADADSLVASSIDSSDDAFDDHDDT